MCVFEKISSLDLTGICVCVCWWFHTGTVSLLVTDSKMALPMISSFCQSSSWFCNANEVHGFTQGLSVLMTKPLQVWGKETLRNFLLWKGILLLCWFESQLMVLGQKLLLLLPIKRLIYWWRGWSEEVKNLDLLFLLEELACYWSDHLSSLIRPSFILGMWWYQ